MKELLLNLAFWILKRYNVNYFIYPSEGLQLEINALVDQVETKWGKESGEFKRSQALRAIMNSHPSLTERETALAIELSIQRFKV